MENIKKGEELVLDNDEYKVLAVVDGIYFVSYSDNKKNGGIFYTLEGLKEAGYTLKQKEWPQFNSLYWYVDSLGNILNSYWSDKREDKFRKISKNIFEER